MSLGDPPADPRPLPFFWRVSLWSILRCPWEHHVEARVPHLLPICGALETHAPFRAGLLADLDTRIKKPLTCFSAYS